MVTIRINIEMIDVQTGFSTGKWRKDITGADANEVDLLVADEFIQIGTQLREVVEEDIKNGKK